MNILESINPKGKQTLMLTIKVRPQSMSDEIIGVLEGSMLKVAVRATPEQGRANSAVEKLLKKKLGALSVEIITGHTTSKKRVLIKF